MQQARSEQDAFANHSLKLEAQPFPATQQLLLSYIEEKLNNGLLPGISSILKRFPLEVELGSEDETEMLATMTKLLEGAGSLGKRRCQRFVLIFHRLRLTSQIKALQNQLQSLEPNSLEAFELVKHIEKFNKQDTVLYGKITMLFRNDKGGRTLSLKTQDGTVIYSNEDYKCYLKKQLHQGKIPSLDELRRFLPCPRFKDTEKAISEWIECLGNCNHPVAQLRAKQLKWAFRHLKLSNGVHQLATKIIALHPDTCEIEALRQKMDRLKKRVSQSNENLNYLVQTDPSAGSLYSIE